MSRRARIDLSRLEAPFGRTSAVDVLAVPGPDGVLLSAGVGSGKTNTIVLLVSALRAEGMLDKEINERLIVDQAGRLATDVCDELIHADE